MKQTKAKGITLIALVITIIVLIILASVSINLLLGENGLLTKTKDAKQTYSEQQAREKLELVLLDLQTDKETKKEYNEQNYINTKLQEKEMIVNGDIVLVDDYQFQIDRSVPKIATSLGKGALEEKIQISISSKTSSDYTKATIIAQISYEQELTEILLNEERIEIPEKQEGKYNITKEINTNGIYYLVAKDGEEKFNIANITITDITEDMIINTVEDLIAFRDKVNKGTTFEGKTVKLMNDLNLQDICNIEEGSWKPIGNEEHPFKGIFDGKHHTIDYLYINTTEDYQGLFGYSEGIIQNLILSNINIYNTASYTAALAGKTNGNIINIIVNSGEVCGTQYIGGITGYSSNCKIELCINKATIKYNTQNSNYGRYTGGISGYNQNSVIEKCINEANIIGTHGVGGIVGVDNAGTINLCANIDNINCNSNTNNGYSHGGGICGYATYGDTTTIENCYNSANITSNSTSKINLGGIAGSIASSGCVKNTIINTCYFSGNISSGTYKGGIIGAYSGTSNISALNNYWKTNCGASYGFGIEKSNTQMFSILDSQIKDVANMNLGEEFVNDIRDTKTDTWIYNNGYPILKWQLPDNISIENE